MDAVTQIQETRLLRVETSVSDVAATQAVHTQRFDQLDVTLAAINAKLDKVPALAERVTDVEGQQIRARRWVKAVGSAVIAVAAFLFKLLAESSK